MRHNVKNTLPRRSRFQSYDTNAHAAARPRRSAFIYSDRNKSYTLNEIEASAPGAHEVSAASALPMLTLSSDENIPSENYFQLLFY